MTRAHSASPWGSHGSYKCSVGVWNVQPKSTLSPLSSHYTHTLYEIWVRAHVLSWVRVTQSSDTQSKAPHLKSIQTTSEAPSTCVSEGKAHPKGPGGPILRPRSPSTGSKCFLHAPAQEVFLPRTWFPAGLGLGLRTLVPNSLISASYPLCLLQTTTKKAVLSTSSR